MYFNSLSDFINMGGHGLYVWSSYTLTLVLLLSSVLLPWLNLKRTRKQLSRQLAREAARTK